MKTQEALDALLRPLREALGNAKETGALAIRQGRFAEAQSQLRRAEEIADRIKQLEELQHDWDRLLGQPPQATGPRPRAPRGERTPEPAFWVPILAALEEMGGSGPVGAVLDRVERIIGSQLSDVDRQLLSDGRSVRWRNTAMWARKDMVTTGLLERNSPRGIWRISDAGRAYLRGQKEGR